MFSRHDVKLSISITVNRKLNSSVRVTSPRLSHLIFRYLSNDNVLKTVTQSNSFATLFCQS